jgi:hypothetical protein
MQLTKIRNSNKLINAASTGLQSVPIAAVCKPYNWVDRKIDAPLIADSRKVPKVLSCITSLVRFACPGFDWNLAPIDSSDDTQSKAIDAALKAIKSIDKRIGRVGKSRKAGTLGLVRRTTLDTLSYRQSVNEWAQGLITDIPGMGQLNGPTEVQNVPSMTLYRPPTTYNDPDKFITDNLLKGIIFDIQQDKPRFFQARKWMEEPAEVNSDQILYIEDLGIPDDTSFLGALVPSIEQWKAMRKNLMIGMHRGMAAPNEVARMDILDIATAKEKGISINLDDLQAYATALVENQGTETAKLAVPGLRLEYPSISLPLNPTEPDKFLQMEIIAHFFARDILEVTAQAISATSAPGKAVLDMLIASYRETNGKPWEDWWYNTFLEPNGWGDLSISFDWWDWTPKDQSIQIKDATLQFQAGGSLINDYRKKCGDTPYSDEELTKLYAERQSLAGGMF